MRQPPLDGSLLDWEDVEAEYSWRALLVGNGLSINIWGRFDYRSLYKEARDLGELTSEDRPLFDAFKTQNFETVLGHLRSAVGVLDALNRNTSFLLRRHRRIQESLGEAVRSVHIPWVDVPHETLGTIQRVLHAYEWVFTTNYDLLVYWAMGHEDDYGELRDLFWGPSCRFNPADVDVRAGSIPVFFLHGAMHLIVEGSGRVRKLTKTGRTLLDQFGDPIPGDSKARPLLVTEGSSAHKIQAIDGNPYLAHAFRALQSSDLNVPLVVFGSNFGDQDRHISDALSAHPERPVAVSMRPRDKASVRAKQRDLFGRIEAKPLVFYDATTHPLGADDLAPLSA